jgi:tetratricopeptide (TPR) repeat protein
MSPKRWWTGLCDRWLGYEPVGRWRLYRVDEGARRRGSLPERVPVPRGALPLGRLPVVTLAGFAAEFLARHPRRAEAAALRRLVAKAPLAERIEIALRESRWRDAEPLLRRLLAIDPGDARARFLLGLCRLQAGDPVEARACFDEVAPRMDPDAEFHVALGRLHEAEGRIGEARAAYERALERQPDHEGALERSAALGDRVEIFLGTLDAPERAFIPAAEYEDLIARGWDAEAHPARFFLERSHYHLRAGQTRLALRAAERALAAEPAARVEALAAQCRAQIALGRLDEAETAARSLEAEAPDAAGTASCRGHLAWARGDREAAARAVRRALAQDANRMEDLRLCLDPRFPRRAKALGEAISHLLNQYPQSFAVKSIAACALLAEEDRDRGLELALAATRLGAGDDCLLDMTGMLRRAGLDDAVCRIADLAGGLPRFAASDPLLRSNLAAALERCGRAAEAGELWRSIADDPGVHPSVRLRAREAAAPR